MKDYFFTPLNKRTFQINLAIIALFCLLIGTYTWSPGMIIVDTAEQYLQALGKLPCNDWFSPLETRLWQLEVLLFKTPSLMVFTITFLITLALWILIQLRPCRLGYVLYLLIFFLPSVFGFLSVIRSDLFLSALILLSAACIILLEEELSSTQAKSLKYFTIFLLVLAAFMRVNAPFIAVPLLISLLFGWKFNFKSLFISLCGVLFFIAVTGIVNHKILNASNAHAESSLKTFDIGGIAYFSSPPLNDEKIFKEWKTETETHQLAACYMPQQWDTYAPWGCDPKTNIWNKSDDKIINDRIVKCRHLGDKFRNSIPELNEKWLISLKNHPIAYFEHRTAHFFSFTLGNGLGVLLPWTDPGYYPVDLGTIARLVPEKAKAIPNYYPLEKRTADIQGNIIEQKYRKWFSGYEGAFWNKGGFWFILAFLICTFSWRCDSKRKSLINCFSFSALMYILGYFFVGVSHEFRYLLPAIYLLYATILFIFYLTKSSKDAS